MANFAAFVGHFNAKKLSTSGTPDQGLCPWTPVMY